MLVDVSYHNGTIDWSRVKASGVEGAIIRCGYGRDFQKYDDIKFKQNMDGALAVGIKVGVYIYSYAKSIESAKSEAAHVLRLIAPYKGKILLPIYYDLEEPGTEDGAKARAEVFGDIIEANGYPCGVYASSYWWSHYLKGLDRFTKWVAQWNKDDGKPGEKPTISNCDLWQYTSRGRVNGISGVVDLNEAYGYIRKLLDGDKDPEPTPEPDKEDKVMVELSVLRKGDKSEEVFTLQAILKAKGYKGSNGKVLALDKSFGGNTESAVKAFQADKGLSIDGVVGAKTWDALLKG